MSPAIQRQVIVDKLKLRLAKIRTDTAPLEDGFQYTTNLGKNPIDEWPTNYQEDELKVAESKARMGLFDLVRAREKEYLGQGGIQTGLPMQVRIFHHRDVTPAQLRIFCQEVLRAVTTDPDTGKEDLTLNGSAIDIAPGDDGFIVPGDVFTIDATAVGFTVYHQVNTYGM
jgi:hypothetical protein